MTATTCTHGFGSPKSCLDCMDDDGLGAPPVQPVFIEYTFSAMSDGPCSGCTSDINIGQRIAKMSDDTYRHVGCTT